MPLGRRGVVSNTDQHKGHLTSPCVCIHAREGRVCSSLIASDPQSSSASRRNAGAFGFFILSQSAERPER
jgi:hypothetical protein